MTNEVTQVLNALANGDERAATQLFPLVYDELRRLATRKMGREYGERTLQPTALVHEAFLRLVGSGGDSQWDNRGHFFIAAAESMRRILIEQARRKKAQKRGGELAKRPLSDIVDDDGPVDPETLLALDEALDRLAEVDSEAAQLVKLRFFAGLSNEDAARSLGISPRTAKRNWSYARAWLRRELEGILPGK